MRVLFLGSKSTGLSALEAVDSAVPGALCGVVTIDDSTDTRSALSGFGEYCARTGRTLELARSRKHADEVIRQYRPDLCVVMGWYWLLGADILRETRFIGIHASPLPRYRGSSPLVWQMILGETQACASLFTFTEGMDEGDIWKQEFVPVEPDDYIADVLAKIESVSTRMIRETLPGILAGSLSPTPQMYSEASYCSQRQPDDGLIDWRKSAEQIYNEIRAQSRPYPGAFTYHHGEKLTIWRARRFAHPYCGVPGAVLRVGEDGVYVACGDHRALILGEVQLEGAPAVGAATLLRSFKIRLGRQAEPS